MKHDWKDPEYDLEPQRWKNACSLRVLGWWLKVLAARWRARRAQKKGRARSGNSPRPALPLPPPPQSLEAVWRQVLQSN